MRVLVLSVGSLAAHNVLSSLQRSRSDHFIIGTNSLAETAGAFFCDVAFRTPPVRDAEAYANALLEIIETERPNIVVPTRDDDVIALAKLKSRYEGPPVLLAGSLSAAEIMDDKRLTAAFAQRHHLPFAATADTHAGALQLAEQHGYPLIAKPARGNGSRGVTLLLERSHLDAAFQVDEMVVQPFLDGPFDTAPYSALLQMGVPLFFSFPVPNQYAVQIIVGADGGFSKPYASLHTQVMGKSERSERIYDEQLLDVGLAYARAIRAEGWVGSFNAQFKRTPEGRFVGFELGGRFTGTSGARALCGFNEWDEVLRGFGFASAADAAEPSDVQISQAILTHYPVPSSGLDSLQKFGVWRKQSGTVKATEQSAF